MMQQTSYVNFGEKNWIQINDEPRGTYNAGNEIKFKTPMIRSNYLIIVMPIYILKDLQQSQTHQKKERPLMIEIGKYYVKVVLCVLFA